MEGVTGREGREEALDCEEQRELLLQFGGPHTGEVAGRGSGGQREGLHLAACLLIRIIP